MNAVSASGRLEMERMRVFEVSVSRGDAIDAVVVDLPTAWARTHARVEVSLSKDELGWYARLVGDDDEHLLGFPWHDDVDKMLLAQDARSLPIDLAAGAWDDVEQGWWATVIAAGSRVYLAEANFDELVDDVADPRNVARKRPGVVTVDGVEVRWNRVPRAGYDDAWKRAIARLRRTG
jgi:hypothetical protein